MKIITRSSRAAEIVTRWELVYKGKGRWRAGGKTIYEKLLALGDNPNPDDVDEIIGNASWTEVGCCNECGNQTPTAIVELGETLSYDSSTAYICLECIAKLNKMLEDLK